MKTRTLGPASQTGIGVLAALITIFCFAPEVNAQAAVELPGRDVSLTPQLEDVYSIGSLMGEEWEAFSSVNNNQVGFDAAGNLYVLERQGSRVVIVDPEGNLIREVGQAGEGPGEFQRPTALAVHRDGSFAVFDVGHFAMIHFDSNGEMVEHATVEIRELPGRRIISGPGGTVLSAGGQGVVMMRNGESSAPDQGVPLRRYPAPGEGSVETVYTAWAPPPSDPAGISVSGGTFRLGAGTVVAFQPQFSFGVRPDGTAALSDSLAYRIKLVDSSGDLARILSRPFDRRLVTRRDQEREKERRLAELEEGGGQQFSFNIRGGGGQQVSQAQIQEQVMESRRQSIEQMQFAEEFPILARVAVDWEGRIWAERTGEDPSGPGPIDVIGADDSYLGTISEDGMRIPFAFGPNGLVAYVETDEFDVPKVVVRRMTLN